MAPVFATVACHLPVAVLVTAALFASVNGLRVSPRLDLPSSSSIGIAPSTHWVDEEGRVAQPSQTAVRAVLEVVVPTPSASIARVVCVSGAKGCDTSSTASTSSTTTSPDDDDDEPLIIVGSADKTTTDDETPDKKDSKGKVFFVDEDSDEDAIKDVKTKKKDKKTVDVPIIVSYDGWKGTTEDDIPISPRNKHYNTNYDMEHDYSGISAPAHFTLRQQPNYKTVRTDDVPVTYWDVPLGSESLLVAQLVKSSLDSNTLSQPQYWRPSYDRRNPNWRPRGPNGHYPGVYRPIVNRRTFQPTPLPGFYGGMTPRVYSGYRPTSGVWCPPGSPGWPHPRPVYPTTSTTTTPKPVQGVDDKLDFDDSEEDKKEDEGKKGLVEDGVKVIGKVDLSDWK